MCSGSGKSWIKEKRKTVCPVCKKTIAKLGGHPNRSVSTH
jgi:hypothetical protein